MIFGRSNQPGHHRVYIDNIVIQRVNCNKFLGVIVDSKLSWSDHVSYIRHKMSKNLSVMHRVKWFCSLRDSALYLIRISSSLLLNVTVVMLNLISELTLLS